MLIFIFGFVRYYFEICNVLKFNCNFLKMNKIKISAVSYLNTYPFLYGIYSNKNLLDVIELTTDYPSICANKLLNNEVDIGLVPVAIIPQISNSKIITNFCISSNTFVKSVLLLSEKPLTEIKNIYLDYQSKTSITLIKILAKFFWNISPNWIEAKEGFENNISGENAAVVIGDRALNLLDKYKFVYDLSYEWYKNTNLPFVFAVWLSNKNISDIFTTNLNYALQHGVNNINNVISFFSDKIKNINFDAKKYLTENINFYLDDKKKDAINLFLDFKNKL